MATNAVSTARKIIGQKAAELMLEAIASPDNRLGRKVVIPPKIDLGRLA